MGDVHHNLIKDLKKYNLIINEHKFMLILSQTFIWGLVLNNSDWSFFFLTPMFQNKFNITF